MKGNNQTKLRQINNVATQTSSVGSDPDNCMPKAEYERLCKEGKLTKSVYVCGEGICFPPVHVYEYSSSGSSSGEQETLCPICHIFHKPSEPCCGSADNPFENSGEESGEKEPTPGGGGTTSGGGSQGGGGGGALPGSPNKGNDKAIADVLPTSKFSGFRNNDPRGCYTRCCEMLKSADCKPVGMHYEIVNGKQIVIDPDIIMVNYTKDGTAGVPTGNVQIGLNYIDSQLSKNHPVMVAVDYKKGTSRKSNRTDQASDHFVVIVGGSRTYGYHYFDPATKDIGRGTSANNRFVLNNDRLSDDNNCTLNGVHHYTIVSIIKNAE